jgi:3-hydroxypropanoate dehydrogenase
MPRDVPLSTDCLDQIFLEARTFYKWTDRPVPDELLRRLVDILKMGPTSANQSPARIIFVKSQSAKARLAPLLDESNREKTMAAPVCAIIGHDLEFYEHFGKLFPHAPDVARSWFAGKPEVIQGSAFRNGTLQGAYLIIAARALGLDTGPMSGFDNAGVDREFFAGTQVKSNFLCNLGFGDPSEQFPRSPRFDFDEMAKIV